MQRMADLDLSEGLAIGGDFKNQDLAVRRRLERAAIRRADARQLVHGECWCVVDAAWLDLWADFVRGGVPPGPMTNGVLLNTDTGAALPHLALATDYRCVNPAVYALYEELWGTGTGRGRPTAPIARWVTDVHAGAVDAAEASRVLKKARLRARAEAQTLRCQFVHREPIADDDESQLFSCGWCCDQCLVCCAVVFRLLTDPASRSKPSRAERTQYAAVNALDGGDEERSGAGAGADDQRSSLDR